MAKSNVHSYIPLSSREKEILQGLMLGDGSLAFGKASRNSCLTITRARRDEEYAYWLRDEFKNRLTPKSIMPREKFDERTNKTYQSIVFRSRCDSVFNAEQNRWYPKGVKNVPKDLEFSALMVAIWFADDGSITASSRRCPDVKFATHSFTKPDVYRLAQMLEERYSSPFAVYKEKDKNQHTIRGFGESGKRLLREIDPLFPPMARKSDKWRKSELLDDRIPPPNCVGCGSQNVYYYGKNKANGQKLKCMDCNFNFLMEYQSKPYRRGKPSISCIWCSSDNTRYNGNAADGAKFYLKCQDCQKRFSSTYINPPLGSLLNPRK